MASIKPPAIGEVAVGKGAEVAEQVMSALAPPSMLHIFENTWSIPKEPR